MLLGGVRRPHTADTKTAEARKIKCIVWDLDNTLWKGTLVEGDEVVLNPGIEELLKYFDERGILLSVVSKNDFDPAWKKLQSPRIAGQQEWRW